MEMKTLAAVKNVKNISKEKVTLPRIYSYFKKSSKNVNKEDLINIIDHVINRGNFKKQGNEPNSYYYVPTNMKKTR